MTIAEHRPDHWDGATGVRPQLPTEPNTHLIRHFLTDAESCDSERCFLPAEHRLGSQRLCNLHYRQLTQPIRLKYAKRDNGIDPHAVIGVGDFVTPHPDYPLRILTRRIGCLVCNIEDCGATWVGVEGNPCSWCIRRVVRS